MEPQLPYDTRPKSYAGIELLLDIVHAARSVADLDMESMLIYFCVSEATMRPLMLGEGVPPEMRTIRAPPERYRGSISMMMVADKLGLPRETVRRKIKALVNRGLCLQDQDGRIRVVSSLHLPASQAAADATVVAVQRYLARLQEFGVELPAPNEPHDAAKRGVRKPSSRGSTRATQV